MSSNPKLRNTLGRMFKKRRSDSRQPEESTEPAPRSGTPPLADVHESGGGVEQFEADPQARESTVAGSIEQARLQSDSESTTGNEPNSSQEEPQKFLGEWETVQGPKMWAPKKSMPFGEARARAPRSRASQALDQTAELKHMHPRKVIWKTDPRNFGAARLIAFKEEARTYFAITNWQSFDGWNSRAI